MLSKPIARELAKQTAIATLIAIVTVGIAYFWIDKPVAWFVYHQNFKQYPFFEWFTYIPKTFVTISPVILVCVLISLAFGRYSPLKRLLLAFSASVICASAVKNFLKFTFGRYWPETWIYNNPSLIHNNAYGFHPFHWGTAYNAFPSGHTLVTFVAMMLLWRCYPRWRWLYATICGLVIVGLVANNYHFVGDVIAGAILGTIAAAYAYYLFGLDSTHPR